MMAPIPVKFPLSSNPARHGHAGDSRLINGYPESLGDEGKGGYMWVPFHGFDAFSTLTDGGGVRAMLALTDADLYVVAGRLLFRVDTSGTATALGGISSDGMVTMARNRLAPDPQIAIVCDGLYYIIRAGVLTQMADPDLPPPVSVCSLNGYFCFLLSDGRHFSSELDGEDVSALDYAAAGSNPDPGVRNWTRGQDLCIGGTKSIEFWADQGLDPYPFARTTSVDVGVLAADSVAPLDQTSAFVAHDGTVRVLEGYQPQVVSNTAVAKFIAFQTDPTTLRATSWIERGKHFYALSSSDTTWVYCHTTKTWSERESYGLGRWRVSTACAFGNRVVFGNYADGLLYLANRSTQDEAGDHMVMTIQPPPVHAFPYRLRHNIAYIDAVPGVGTADVPSPVVMLDYSDDGGRVFGAQRHLSLGAEGQSLTTLRANKLGAARSRIYRLRVSDAVERGLLGMSVDAEKIAV